MDVGQAPNKLFSHHPILSKPIIGGKFVAANQQNPDKPRSPDNPKCPDNPKIPRNPKIHKQKNTPGRHKWRPGVSNTKAIGLFAQVCAADDLTQRKDGLRVDGEFVDAHAQEGLNLSSFAFWRSIAQVY